MKTLFFLVISSQAPAVSAWRTIDLEAVALWGLVATLVLSTLLYAAEARGLSRMSMPYMLGAMWTTDRRKAKALGLGLHLANGWIFALLYVWAFEWLGLATWWLGAMGGLVHAGVILTLGMATLPYVHPHMATERQGPTPTEWLQPPGFLGMNYGRRTVYVALVAHAIYGAILGGFYGLGG